ncbi:hypothetical protein [Brevibacillus sp. IT-7CA2]
MDRGLSLSTAGGDDAIPALAKNDSAMIWIESTGMGYNYFAELFPKS